MTDLRSARPEDIPRQKELWKAAFHDEDSYIDLYYDRFHCPEQVLVLEKEGEIRTMVVTFPLCLHLPDGTSAPSAYLYAFATDPRDRGKGYGRRIYAYAEERFCSSGGAGTVTVPAEPSLFRYFSSIGYRKCFSHRKAEYSRKLLPPVPADGQIHPVEAERYNALRNGLLEGSFYAAYSDELIAHQKAISRLAQADIYELELGGVSGAAAAEYIDEDSVLLKELLFPGKRLTEAVSLVSARLPASRYFVRTPVFWDLPGGYVQDFGMIKLFGEELDRQLSREVHGYLGLAFD